MSDPNCFLLDFAEYRFNDEDWNSSEDVLFIDFKIRKRLGLTKRGGLTKQPWARKKNNLASTLDFELRLNFEVDALPGGEIFLGLERPEFYEIYINGHLLNSDMETDWWVDPSLRRIPLKSDFLRHGQNTINLKSQYHAEHSGLENIFLLGDFGVAKVHNSFQIIEAPKTLKLGNWVEQSLPFYGGNLSYHTQIKAKLRNGERAFLRVDKFEGVAVKIYINEVNVGIIAWEPHEIEITQMLSGGQDRLTIEVLGHRRNSHGPFHNANKRLSWTGPQEFVTSNKNRVESHNLVKCGLMVSPSLIIKT